MENHLENKRQSHIWELALSENTKDHVNARVQSGRRAFYGLQSAGLCTNGVTPDATAHMIAIQPVLVYGCATININPGAIKTLEKTQGRLLNPTRSGGRGFKSHPPPIFCSHAFNFGAALLCVGDFSQKIV